MGTLWYSFQFLQFWGLKINIETVSIHVIIMHIELCQDILILFSSLSCLIFVYSKEHF